MIVPKELLLFPLLGVAIASPLESCPGYRATRVHHDQHSLTADLSLAGKACNTYGTDIKDLRLQVEYQTDTRLHVLIYDADENVYQVPESVFPRPTVDGPSHKPRHGKGKGGPALQFTYKEYPFSFTVSRVDNGETLFSTAGSNLIFQSQYINLRTTLPQNPNLYGMGEHSDPFRLNTTDYTHTVWNRDAYTIPAGTNLYGAHPVYMDHRGKAGTHGVFLLSSSGMDVKVDKDAKGTQFLEYNLLGGVVDLYFMAGPTPSDVSVQYAEIAGLPAMVPYWGFGFHQCRYGYQDIFNVAEVVYNYSKADIPLETMWTDIDYMDHRKVFTLDPERFPLESVRALVSYLHEHNQHYIVMVDPAVSTENNGAYDRGVAQDIFLKHQDGSLYEGVVWPGPTVFPDWFHPDTPAYWINEFARFFDSASGVDIDALWIDMNEAANFCDWPCSDPEGFAEENNFPPEPPAVRPNPRSLPGFPPEFQTGTHGKRGMSQTSAHRKRGTAHNKPQGNKLGLPGRDLVDPPYMIANAAGSLSNKTINTDIYHENGLVEYDTHNLYGSMMSSMSREAMLHRRPEKRPMVITRSTFAGAGAHVGHWLGDNASTWEKYRISIAQMLAFASIFQVPMVGSDVCGFSANTTPQLCARWAMLGAFNPFYRNHNEYGSLSQEFYRWPVVAEAARKAISIRYQLLDYLYTAFHAQTETGEPFLLPLFFAYPEDVNTFGIDLQFFYGPALLVSPVTQENSTSVDVYLPDDIFYDWYTGSPVRGRGKTVTLENQAWTDIPLHIRGGNILPVRAESASTTTELREKDFRLIIAPGLDGRADGRLYLDDGESLHQRATLEVEFKYYRGRLTTQGGFSLKTNVRISSVTVLGETSVRSAGGVTVETDISLHGPVSVRIQ